MKYLKLLINISIFVKMKKNKHLFEAVILYGVGSLFFFYSGYNNTTFYFLTFLGVLNYLAATVQVAMYYFNID